MWGEEEARRPTEATPSHALRGEHYMGSAGLGSTVWGAVLGDIGLGNTCGEHGTGSTPESGRHECQEDVENQDPCATGGRAAGCSCLRNLSG